MVQANCDRQQELRLLSAVLDGDRQASRSFFERYNCTVEMCVRKVLRHNRRRVSEEDVRDLAGEVWLSLLEDDKRPLRRFNPARDIRVSTWLGLLARNKTIDRLRCRRAPTVSLEQAREAAERPAPMPLPSEELETQECRRLASRALQELSEEERAFLESWYLDDRQPSELAQDLNVTLGTVYSRRFKIQVKLARVIARYSRSRAALAPSTTIH